MNDFVPLTGEPLAVDLINSRAKLPGVGWVDGLDEVSGLRLWLRMQQDRLAFGGDRLTRADLDAVRQLRDDARDAVAAVREGRRPAPAAVERINEALRAAPASRTVRWGAEGLAYEAIRPPGAGKQILSQLAEATAELLTDGRVHKIRDCAMPDCVMLFYPTRPSRKWCTDAICGNRARAARHYRRHRGSRTHSPATS